MINIKNEKGSLLVLTMFAIGILSTFIIGFLVIVTADLRVAAHDSWSRQAEFVAEAGMMEAIYQLSLDDNWSAGFTNVSVATGQDYTVAVTNAAPNVTLLCTGVANGYTKEIEVELSIGNVMTNGRFRVRLDTRETL